MNKESIIAQVDYSTEQIMKDISNDITSAIGENFKDIKDDTKVIEDIVEQTEEITRKLSGFDGLSSSLAELKVFSQESKQLAERISPLESQIIDLHKNIDNVFEQGENKTNEVLSVIGTLQSSLEEELYPVKEIANKVSGISEIISSLEATQNTRFADVTGSLRSAEEHNLLFSESALQSLSSITDNVQIAKDDVTSLVVAKSDTISQKIQEIDALLHCNVDKLNARIDTLYADIQNLSLQSESHFNLLKETLEKVQVTLDIVVNLTTPFWKKWTK